MHELSIAQDLISLILQTAEQNQARRVTSVTLEIGELSGVEPDALTLAYEVVSRGTLAEGSQMVIEHKPLTVRCPACCWEGEAEKIYPVCGGCGQLSVQVTGGREMRLLSIDIDQPEDDPEDHPEHDRQQEPKSS
jgi:hydrogenase nickel incorporation protein HypA/HybF